MSVDRSLPGQLWASADCRASVNRLILVPWCQKNRPGCVPRRFSTVWRSGCERLRRADERRIETVDGLPRAHQAKGEMAREKRLSMVIAGSQSSQTTVTTSRAALPSYWQQVRQRSLRCSSSRHTCEHHEVTNRQLSWSGDQSATWRVANRQLHSKPPAYHSDDDCARLSATFVQ